MTKQDLTTGLAMNIYQSMNNLIDEANNNTWSIGFCIVIGHISINVGPDDREDFWDDLSDIEKEYNVTFFVNDYDDLCMTTDQYEGED